MKPGNSKLSSTTVFWEMSSIHFQLHKYTSLLPLSEFLALKCRTRFSSSSKSTTTAEPKRHLNHPESLPITSRHSHRHFKCFAPILVGLAAPRVHHATSEGNSHSTLHHATLKSNSSNDINEGTSTNINHHLRARNLMLFSLCDLAYSPRHILEYCHESNVRLLHRACGIVDSL